MYKIIFKNCSTFPEVAACQILLNSINVSENYSKHKTKDVLPARRNKRGTCYGNVAGWLGVSVTRRYCIKTAKLILKLFRPPGNLIILVSSDPCADTQFQGEPLQRGHIYTGVGKIWRFSTDIAVCLGNGTR